MQSEDEAWVQTRNVGPQVPQGQNIQSHKNINTLDIKIPQETNARSPFGDGRRLIFVSLQNGAKLYPWPL